MIRAIPTMYRGVTFRSRLEARWAVFYDALGIGWHYEHEGYQLPSGWYLPDFWLPDLGCHVEIKPPDPFACEVGYFLRCIELAEATGHRVFCFHSEVTVPSQAGVGAASMFGPDSEDSSPLFCWSVCDGCGVPSIAHLGHGSGVRCSCPHGETDTSSHPHLLACYDHVRSWRFWP